MTTFTQTGGVRIGTGFGAFNASWPFAGLRVDDTELVLTCLWERWTFPKSSIRRLSRHEGVFSFGLRIEHSIESYPQFMVFWTFLFGHLQQDLQERGYVISQTG